MRKGEERKQCILKTAQQLFCENGYASTSIDEIISILSLSKGGFYHYFSSKESLLLEICKNKAEDTVKKAKSACESIDGTWADKFNALFDSYGLWGASDADFMTLLMTIPDIKVRETLKSELTQKMLPLLREIVIGGVNSGEFTTPYPEGTADLILQLGTSFSDVIARALSDLNGLNTVQILSDLELYRYAIEKVLGAPYGSIVHYEMRPMTENLQMLYERRQNTLNGGNSK